MNKWLVGLTCAWMGLATAMGQTAWFNEINYDPVGTDVAGSEWLEVAGPAGIDLSSYVVVRYNGANGAVYGTTTLSGTIDDEGCGYGAVELVYPGADSLQNGAPDGLALAQVNAGVTTLVQFISYEGAFLATNGPATGVTSVGVGTQLSTTNLTLQLAGAATNYDDFAWETNMPSMGSLNLNQSIAGCTPVQQTNVYFFASGALVDEDQGIYEVTVYKSVAEGDMGGQIALSGTATLGGGADYTVDTTNFTLNGTTTSAVISVTINDDGDSELAETVVMDLANVTGAATGSPATFTLTINPSDQTAYGITIVTNAPENGTVTTTPAGEAIEGAAVAITATPVGGYRVASIAVVDEAMNPVAVTGNAFTMPASAVTVTVTFEVYVAPDVLIDFEDYTGSYASNNYSAGGVIWAMTNVYAGNTADDHKNGTKAGRFEHNRGGAGNTAIMQSSAFAQPLTQISLLYANFGVNDGGAFKVQVSSDGASWQDVGSVYDPSSIVLTEAVIDSIPAGMTYMQIVTTAGSAQRVNIDDIGLYFGEATFGVTFDKVTGFTVEQGTSDSVYATAANGVAPYTYGWTSSLEGTYFTADSNRFTILATAPTGSYMATAVATDSDTPAKSVTNSLNFSVVPPATKYGITIVTNIPGEGTVTTTPATEAVAGVAVTIQITPADGYRAASVVVNGGAVAVVGNVFTMPAEPATVTVTFEVYLAPDVLIDFETNTTLSASAYTAGTSLVNNISFAHQRVLRGNAVNDRVHGVYAARCYPVTGTNAFLYTTAAFAEPITKISFWHANYGSENGTTFKVQVSPDGATWEDVGSVIDPESTTLTEVVLESIPANATYVQFITVSGTVRINIDDIGLWFGVPTFSVSVNKSNGFIVNEGSSDSITATAANGTPPYSYAWISTLGSSYYTTNANVFSILATAPTGSYSATVTATDATLATAERTVTFSVVGLAPGQPAVLISGTLSGEVGVEMALSVTVTNETANDWVIDLKDPDGLDEFSYGFVPPAFTFTPTKTGTYVLTATAQTGSGNYSNTVSLTIGGGEIWTIGGGTGGAMFTTLSNIIIVLPTNFMLNAVYGSDASGAGLNNLGQGLGTLTPGLDYTWTPATRTVTILNSVTNRRIVRIGATPP